VQYGTVRIALHCRVGIWSAQSTHMHIAQAGGICPRNLMITEQSFRISSWFFRGENFGVTRRLSSSHSTLKDGIVSRY
jgi:hypothetical protein